MFEFLFNYPFAYFRDGSIELAAPGWLYACLLLAVAFLLPSLFRYSKVQGEATTRDRLLLTALRTAVIAVIVFSLFQPILVVPLSSDERSIVAILFDDSRSMRIEDQDGSARRDVVTAQFSAGEGDLRAALSRRFDLQLYRFGAATERIESIEELSFAEGATDLGKALSQVRDELSGLPLAALVVVSDGAHNVAERLEAPLSKLRPGSAPVHTVGIGREAYRQDLEVGPVEVPATVLQDSNLVVSVPIRTRGFEDIRVPVIAEAGGQILDTSNIELSGDGTVRLVNLNLRFTEPGLRRLRVRIPIQSGETVAENNQREFLLVVRDRAERILHFEGEPRFEVKFLRRALTDDPNLEIVSLIRTAENKFYRLGLDDPGELAEGFPSTRQELFKYRALILGSVEASHFNTDQLDMIAEFVSERGGGLLLLGGRRAFAEGGFQETALAEVSPMLLEPRRGPIVPLPANVRPTPAGREHPVTRLEKPGAIADGWSSLPPLTVVNPIHRVKLGATPLLWAAGPDNSEPLQILAVQRFGRGRVAAFSVRNSWQWKMHPDVDPDDRTHELLWRQLLRWLVQLTPDQLELTSPRAVAPGEVVSVSADLRDGAFAPQSNAEPRLMIRSPSGSEQTLIMDPEPSAPGAYGSQFVAREEGLYELRTEVGGVDANVLLASRHIQSHPETREYHGAEMQSSTLRRIASQTGGKFYTPAQLDALPNDLVPSSSGIITLNRLELWNMPSLFFLVLALLSVEWFYRRWRALV